MNRYKFINELDEKGKRQHLHTLDGKPLIGTSTALKVLSKPLTWWASGLACAELGWVKPLKPYDKPKPTKEQIEENGKKRLMKATEMLQSLATMNPSEYVSLLDKAYKAHSVKLDTSAEAGTDMHAELEKYVKKMMIEGGEPRLMGTYEHPVIEVFASWAVLNVKRFIASECYCYSEELWTGGIVDLIYEDKEGRIVILDFKSSKEAYLSQFFQDAGYDIAISENGILDAEGNKVGEIGEVSYYGVFPFGMEKPEPQFHYDIVGARDGFKAAVVLHKIINK